jgi:formamidopyrimidine-DNA glycosylase
VDGDRKNSIVCNSFTNMADIGYMPDALYVAGIARARGTKARNPDEEELRRLHQAIKKINQEMLEMHGDILEKDIYGNSGQYNRKMAGHLSRKACPMCGTKIERQYTATGMAVYFCPECRPYKE